MPSDFPLGFGCQLTPGKQVSWVVMCWGFQWGREEVDFHIAFRAQQSRAFLWVLLVCPAPWQVEGLLYLGHAKGLREVLLQPASTCELHFGPSPDTWLCTYTISHTRTTYTNLRSCGSFISHVSSPKRLLRRNTLEKVRIFQSCVTSFWKQGVQVKIILTFHESTFVIKIT